MPKVITIPRANFVGEYLLDGNAFDTNEGTKNNGAASNVSFVDTPVGYQYKCGTFNGTSSGVSLGTPSQLNPASISVSAWFYVTADQSARFIISDSTSGAAIGVYFLMVDTNFKILWGWGNGTTGTQRTTANNVFLPNQWNHVVATRDSSKNQKIYVNGIETAYASTENTATAIYSSLQGLSIGKKGAFAADYFSGNIQSLRIANKVLSESEIFALYLEGFKKLGGKSMRPVMDDLLSRYDFRGDANDIISLNNGIPNGASLTTDFFGNANSAYSFNGSSNSIGLGNVLGATLAVAHTVNMWCLFNNFTGYNALLTKTNSGANANPLDAYTVITTGVLRYFLAAGAGNMFVETTSAVPTGTWCMVTLTYSGNNNSTGMNVYVNGALQTVTRTGAVTPANSTDNALIGSRNGGTTFMNGKIGPVSVYSRELTASQINALYVQGQKEPLYPF